MTNGQKVATVALNYAGQGLVENPWGSNHDNGGPIDKAEKFWGLSGLAYCAMGVSQEYRDAGVPDAGVISPSTYVMCERAEAQGLWLPDGHPVPPGAILILCGIHTEVAISQRSNGWIDAVGWNVNQGVRRTVRQLGGGWRCIVVPALAQGTAEPVVVYGFDDLSQAPKRYGPWHDRAGREAAIASLPDTARHFARRVRIPGRNQYAFDLLSPHQWHFGAWQDKAVRDSKMAAYKKHVGHNLRPWKHTIPDHTAPAGSGGLTTGEATQ